jgi:nucleoside-diphosphate-sugar epimerase
MTKSLVTGGAGFVGRHLIHSLLEAGHEVVCVDPIARFTGGINPNAGWPLYDPRNYLKFKFIKMDCRDWFKLNTDQEFDYAFHLAAMVGGRLMIENNPLVVADDLSIDASFWQWAKDAAPSKSVCFSSSAAYPIKYQTQDNYQLLKEDLINFDFDIGMPDMTYGWAKLTSEYLALIAHNKYNLNTICFRPFSGYGSDQDMNYPFPSICKRVIDNVGSSNIEVWGSGKQMRDFIHIDDCIKGVLLMTDKINNGAAVNLSTGILTSFTEVAKLAAECLGYKPNISGMHDMPEGVFARGGDTQKQKTLGFEAEIDLRAGIEVAIEFIQRNNNAKHK